jgi:hypothetical protein
MCFKKPKPPVVQADPELERERAEAKQVAREERRANKQSRLEEMLARSGGKFGRSSMFSGSAGGSGFAAPLARSLFVEG